MRFKSIKYLRAPVPSHRPSDRQVRVNRNGVIFQRLSRIEIPEFSPSTTGNGMTVQGVGPCIGDGGNMNSNDFPILVDSCFNFKLKGMTSSCVNHTLFPREFY